MPVEAIKVYGKEREGFARFGRYLRMGGQSAPRQAKLATVTTVSVVGFVGSGRSGVGFG